MAERDRVVPVWNRMIGRWEPVDFRHGRHVVAWPHGFRQELLPVPDYQEGDRVQFVRDETCAREGVVRLVLLQCDLARFQVERGEAMKWQHLGADDIIYIVTARGHDHRIKAAHILGRFVSLERISRILAHKSSWSVRCFHDDFSCVAVASSWTPVPVTWAIHSRRTAFEKYYPLFFLLLTPGHWSSI